MNENHERIVFDVAYQPQVRTKVDTRRLMSDVIIACVPVAAVGVYRFGLHVLVLILTSMAAAVFFEWGYRKLNGKRSNASIVIIIILSLAGVVLLEFLAVTISFKQELGMTLLPAMRFTLNYLFTSVGVGVMLQESLAELLFMAIGIFIAWRFLAHTNQGEISQANAIRHSLHPIYGSADDPDWLEK